MKENFSVREEGFQNWTQKFIFKFNKVYLDTFLYVYLFTWKLQIREKTLILANLEPGVPSNCYHFIKITFRSYSTYGKFQP